MKYINTYIIPPPRHTSRLFNILLFLKTYHPGDPMSGSHLSLVDLGLFEDDVREMDGLERGQMCAGTPPILQDLVIPRFPPPAHLISDDSIDDGYSRAPTLGQRIQEDIGNGRYQCGICYEPVSKADKIWHCNVCWSVYDHQCILDWARGHRSLPEVKASIPCGHEWSCPSCKAENFGPPMLYCCESSPN